MTLPGNPGHFGPTDGLTALLRRLETVERSLRELRPQLINGLIVNDLLAAPVSPAFANTSATNFGVTTSVVTVATVTIAVPTGYTRCLMWATADFTITNSGTTATVIGNCLFPTLTGGQSTAMQCDGGGVTRGFSNSNFNEYTGLSGGNVSATATVQCTLSGSVPTNAGTGVNLGVSALFLR